MRESPGWLRVQYAKQLANANHHLEEKLRAGEPPPKRLDDLAALGIRLDPPPVGGRLEIDDRRIEAVYPPPPDQPWPIRAMAAADAAEQRAALRAARPIPLR